MKTKSRRLMVVYVEPEEVLGMMNVLFENPKYVHAPVLTPLPDGYVVTCVFPSVTRNAIGFVVEHESFDEVQPGDEAPEFYCDGFTYRAVAIEANAV